VVDLDLHAAGADDKPRVFPNPEHDVMSAPKVLLQRHLLRY